MKLIISLSRMTLYFLVLALLTGIFHGCIRRSKEGPGERRGITVAGSTSVLPFAEQWAEEYMKKNPGRIVNIQGGGSTAGIQSAISGIADIGTSSRELKDEEKKSLQFKVVAIDGIAVIVNPGNIIRELTTGQIQDIFSRERPRWKNFGGKTSDIHVVSREEGSGTRGAFQEMVMKKRLINPSVMVQDSNGSVREMVASDPDAIGYISLDLVNESVRALRIDGVEPTLENIKGRKYEIVRPFLFVFKIGLSQEAQSFIDYVTGEENRKLIGRQGLIVPEE